MEKYKHHTYPGEQEKSRAVDATPDSSDSEAKSLNSDGGKKNKSEIISGDEAELLIKKTFEEVNETALKELFAQELGKSGGDVSQLNFLSLNTIEIRKGQRSVGSYSFFRNKIYINSSATEDGRDKELLRYIFYGTDNSERVYSHTRLDLLHTIVHEETHAIAHTACVTEHSKDERGTPLEQINVRTGYERTHLSAEVHSDNEVKITNWGKAINEGVTDAIALKIFAQYLESNPLSNCSKSDIETYIKDRNTFQKSAYASYIYALKLFTLLVSKGSGVPPDVVENAIIRGYLRGSEFISDETEAELDKLLGEGMGLFLRNTAEDDNSLDDFIKALDAGDIRLPHKTARALYDAMNQEEG